MYNIEGSPTGAPTGKDFSRQKEVYVSSSYEIRWEMKNGIHLTLP